MKILGIDLGKYKSAACLFDSDTHETLHFTFPSFPNEFKSLLSNTQPELVVIEACALTGWVHDLCQAEGFKILVANTNQNAWCWKHVKRKTDKDDALKLTKLAALGMIDPHRFKNARQVSAYAGLVPRQSQSGESNRMGRITGRGPRLLRSALVEAAWVMLRCNPWAAALYQRICGGQKSRKKQAIIAVARKLLVRCWTLLRKQEKWNPDIAFGFVV